MAITPLPAIVTADILAGRLGVTTPFAGTPLRAVWDGALLDASEMVRDAIGQPITPATSIVPVEMNALGYAFIPLSPVVAVTSLSDDNGNVLDPTTYRNRGQRLYIDPIGRYLSIKPLEPEDRAYVATVSHGWTVIPGEILRWVQMLAAAQIANVQAGSLGINGGASSVAIDDAKVTFTAMSGGIPDVAKQRLRAIYGGEQ